MHRINDPMVHLGLGLALISLALPGCGLRDMRQEAKAVSEVVRITGRVESTVPGTVRVLLTESRPTGDSLVNLAELQDGGSFAFDTEPGTYFVSAYIDQNGDNAFQSGEPAAINEDESGKPAALELAPGETVTLPVLQINGALEYIDGFYADKDLAGGTRNLGRVVDLSEPMFSRDNASLGMWHPLEYMNLYGGGLFFLQPYDPNRIPVVFVHGINGTALDFEPVLARLDRNRYQPWVLQYPSGIDLDTVSNYFLRSLETLHERHAFEQVMVVAHSMGGLMTRAFVFKVAREAQPWSLALVVTVASPLRGMPSAASGVAHSPIVVPSWRDLAPDSGFLRDLAAQDWPDDVPWRLVFTYQSGQDDDGVVALDRQIDAHLQAQAISVYGVNDTHVGSLGNEAFLEHLARWLDEANLQAHAGSKR